RRHTRSKRDWSSDVCSSDLGTEAFNAWGWRIPFLLSLLMVAIAIYIRLQLQETPIFQAIKARGQTSTNPWREAFWSQNIRYVLRSEERRVGKECRSRGSADG